MHIVANTILVEASTKFQHKLEKKNKKPKKIRYDLYIRKDTSEKKKENLAQRKKKQKQKKITVVNLHVRKRYVILSPLQTSK